MVANGRKRSRGILVPTLLQVLLTSRGTDIIMMVIIFRCRLPNLRQMKVSRFLHALLFDFLVILIVVIAMNERIEDSSVARQAIGLGVIRSIRLLGGE